MRVYGRGYYSNEFRGYAFDPDEESFDEDGRLSDGDRASELSAMDFESLVLELGGSMPFGENHRIGVALRVFAWYGGFLDPVIESFHGIFGLANASREFFPQGGTVVNIKNDRGVQIELEGPGMLLGDTEVFGVWTMSEDAKRAWALAWAVELPTGKAGTPRVTAMWILVFSFCTSAYSPAALCSICSRDWSSPEKFLFPAAVPSRFRSVSRLRRLNGCHGRGGVFFCRRVFIPLR